MGVSTFAKDSTYSIYNMKKSQLFKRLLPVLLAAAAFISCETKIDTDSSVEVTEIVFTSPKNGKLDLIQGESERIRYTLVPESALATAVLEWESSDESVAGVKNGKVTAYAPGTATVQATCGKAVSEKVKVTVSPVPLTSFSVPSSLELYVGVEQKVVVSVQPSAANSASLDWEISDEDILRLDFVEGEAILTGLKTGECSIKVSARDFEEGSAAGTPKTISVTVSAPESRAALVYSSASKQVVIKNGDEIDWSNISGPTVSGGKIISIVSIIPDLEESDFKFSSSNESVCTIAYAAPSDPKGANASLILTAGGAFGSSGISVKIADRELGIEHSIDFTLKRTAKGIPGEMVVTDPEGNAVKDGETARIGQNSSGIFSINSGYEAKWTVTGGTDLISLTHSGGDADWAPKAEISAGETTGQATVTVTDQTGKSMSFTVKVTKPFFPSGIYIVDDATGKQAVASGVYIACRGTHSFRLSDPTYKGVWSLTSTNKFSLSTSAASNDITVSAGYDAYSLLDGATLSVTDDAGENTLSVQIFGAVKLNSSFKIAAASGEAAYAVKQPYNFTWKGANTKFAKVFQLYDDSGIKLSNLQGMTVTLIKSRDEADACIGANSQYMRTNGIIPFVWNSKHCRKATIQITDPFGNSVSRDIVPTFDFTDRNWIVKLDRKEGNQSIMTWMNLLYRDELEKGYIIFIHKGESGYNNSLLEDVGNLGDMMDKFANGNLRLSCLYKGDLSSYQCVDVPHFLHFGDHYASGFYILESFDYAGNNQKFDCLIPASDPMMFVALYSGSVPTTAKEREKSFAALFYLGTETSYQFQWWTE